MLSRTGITATLLTAALAAGVIAPPAHAREASFQVTGEGVNGADLNDLITALTAAGKIAEGVNNAAPSETTPEGSSDLKVILDPLSAILDSLSIVSSDELGLDLRDIIPAQRMSPVRGQTADGATVVFPTSGRFTSGYGARWGAQHEGIDIADPIGTPVLAVMDGEVISAGGANGFGKWVRLRHSDGSISVYGHVNTIHVAVGQRVTAGEQIATIGNEGESTGPHLHFEIRPGGGAPVNPVDWFATRGINVR
ncbi:M23 family metallopeptidase [Corynebacterium nasicanis]|uniref:M23 family metallopeptidase n=1 Tax=Corynebacterium nasicanis TaxID=1448267 RepID=A0ABW1QCU4_9CORY